MKPSNGTSTHDGEQLYKFILKSIKIVVHNGPDKNLAFNCDLDPTWMNGSNGTSTCHGERSRQIVKSIHNCRSYGLDKFGRTDRCIHIHRTIVVTTMPRSPQAGSTNSLLKPLWEMPLTLLTHSHTLTPFDAPGKQAF